MGTTTTLVLIGLVVLAVAAALWRSHFQGRQAAEAEARSRMAENIARNAETRIEMLQERDATKETVQNMSREELKAILTGAKK